MTEPHNPVARIAPEHTPPRYLLVGTTHSIAQLRHALTGLDPTPNIAASVAASTEHLLHDLEARLPRVTCDQALISLPLAISKTIRDVCATLERHGVAWRFMPMLSDQLAGRTSIKPGAAAPHALDIASLIERTPRPLDEPAIRRTLARRVVLITGAGGSIGSELARVVGRFHPATLVLVERSENALFEIDREIGRLYPALPLAAVLHDVTGVERTADLIEKYRPNVVFHAAAHKHVPMMEDHPAEAVENNFYGTRSIADAAAQFGVERFVMISTDKAVNPSSVMGATKRLAELYIQHLNMRSDCTYAMVRFGNVLGSACSVLPIWSEQLARGGPVTVTHPDMSRYFMTIPEAAGLVCQAAALAGTTSRGGEVFLLDMGRPVNILDLARRFCLAHGVEPGVDIDIQITGIRPGEKLFEQLAYHSEDMTPTPHESIRTWRTAPPDAAAIGQIIATFDRMRQDSQAWRRTPRQAIINALRSSIPEMVAAAAG